MFGWTCIALLLSWLSCLTFRNVFFSFVNVFFFSSFSTWLTLSLSFFLYRIIEVCMFWHLFGYNIQHERVRCAVYWLRTWIKMIVLPYITIFIMFRAHFVYNVCICLCAVEYTWNLFVTKSFFSTFFFFSYFLSFLV